jgi:hypothetical protein
MIYQPWKIEKEEEDSIILSYEKRSKSKLTDQSENPSVSDSISLGKTAIAPAN